MEDLNFIAIGRDDWEAMLSYLNKNPDLAFLFADKPAGQKAILLWARQRIDEIITESGQDLYKVAPQTILDKLAKVQSVLSEVEE